MYQNVSYLGNTTISRDKFFTVNAFLMHPTH